jgi:hypothetical protein
MKTKTIAGKPPALAKQVAKHTTVLPATTGVTGLVKIIHQQGIKQSTGYQTGDVNYGVEMFVPNNPAAIAKGINSCETIVENALGEKLPQMTDILRSLALQNKS